MNPTYSSVEPLAPVETSSGSFSTPIQIVQPIPSADPSASIQPISDQTACLSPLIMTTPVSSPMVTYLAPRSSISIPQASNSLVNSVPSVKPPTLVSSSPYVYQSIPFGQQIFLANPSQNGFVITQSPGTSYMIAHPQPQFQVRGPTGGQAIPMALVLGAQPASGLIQLPQQPAAAGVVPGVSPPIVCASPAVAVQQAIQPTSFPQIHPGVAVARFPNGCPVAQNATPTSIAPANITTTMTTPVVAGALSTTNTTSTSISSIPVVAASVVATPVVTRQTIATPESVLLELNKEINNLEQLATNSNTPLTPQQSIRLERLIEARDRVIQKIETAKVRSSVSSSASTLTTVSTGAVIRPLVAPSPAAAVSCASVNATLRPRPPGITPPILPAVRNQCPIALSPAMGATKIPIRPISYPPSRESRRSVSQSLVALRAPANASRHPSLTTIQPRQTNSNGQPINKRSEAMSLLVKSRLLPMSLAISAGESVLVEFRLNSQRYQLWLTRAQKVELEQLLYATPSNQRKAELLSVYQQEQSRFFSAHPRPAPPVATQLRLLRPPSVSHSMPPQTPISQPSRQTLSGPTMCVLTPVPNSVASSSTATPTTSNVPLKVPLFGVSTSLVRAPSVISASSSSSITSSANKAPVNQMSVLQSRRLNSVRTLLHTDQIAASSRPPVLSQSEVERPLPSYEELLTLLAPYHVQQDMDNTQVALEKVDDVLNKAFHQLFTRKRQTEDAVQSILTAEKWQLMECPKADRVSLTRLILEGDRERFAAERDAYEKLKTRMNAEESQHRPLPPKRIRSFLKEVAPDFIPLEFDENGNSRPAAVQLEEERREFESQKGQVSDPKLTDEENKSGWTGVTPSPRPLLKCGASVEEGGAWPEWDVEAEPIGVEEEDEEVVVDFQPSLSPEMDIANVVIEDEVNNFDGPDSRSPLNGLPTNFLQPSSSVPEVSKSRVQTDDETSYQRLQHSEDPIIDAAIRSIIDL